MDPLSYHPTKPTLAPANPFTSYPATAEFSRSIDSLPCSGVAERAGELPRKGGAYGVAPGPKRPRPHVPLRC